MRTSSVMKPWSFIFCLNVGITFCVAHAATGEAASGEAASGEAGSGEAGGVLGIDDSVRYWIWFIAFAVVSVGFVVLMCQCIKHNESKDGPKDGSKDGLKKARGSSNFDLAPLFDALATPFYLLSAFGSKAGGKPQPINEVVIPMIATKRGAVGP